RLVALAWDSGATPLIVLTKSDLAADDGAIADDLRATAPGVDVVAVTAAHEHGYAALEERLAPGQTFCLVGRSGAGKSTLANALLGDDRFAVTDIRSDGKGRHTTTFRELVVLPRGGVLIDAPGLRALEWSRDFRSARSLTRQADRGNRPHARRRRHRRAGRCSARR